MDAIQHNLLVLAFEYRHDVSMLQKEGRRKEERRKKKEETADGDRNGDGNGNGGRCGKG